MADMNPWAYLGGQAMSAIGAGMQNQNLVLSKWDIVNPQQQKMWNAMSRQLMSGSGDYGFGSAFKQGKSQLQDYMANRGVSQDSGVGLAAMGNVANGASQVDAQNRTQRWMQLMGTPLQTAQSTYQPDNGGTNWKKYLPAGIGGLAGAYVGKKLWG